MSRKGFTMVEIMVVAGTISLLAALAIPNLVRTRLIANEAAAIGSVKTLLTSMETWRNAHNADFTGASLAALGNPGAGKVPYIDAALASGSKRGYTFAIVLGAPGFGGKIREYDCTAIPTTFGTSGERSFLCDESGQIWGALNGGAVLADADKVPANMLE